MPPLVTLDEDTGLDFTDLFSGGGGATHGLTAAGMRARICTNHWDIAVATHKANNPGVEHRTADLSNTAFGTYPRTAVLWASPSCRRQARAARTKQGTAADELLRDTPDKVDRATAFAILAASEVHAYDAVIVENVPEFAAWVLYPAWVQGMRDLGYKQQTIVLNSADVGPNPVPQERIRWYSVFTRTGDVDLALPVTARTPVAAILDANEHAEILTESRYVTPQIETITTLDDPHIVTCRRNAKARRAADRQMPTITAGGKHHMVAIRTTEGDRVRWMSNLELARAQGFPDDYVWHGTGTDVRRQIGNAVSVNVARFLGERVALALGARVRVAA